MKKIILDTNIYGELVKETDLLKIKDRIKGKEDIIYGVDIIRMELRDTPRGVRLSNKNLRISLLSLYDEFVGKHTIQLNEEMIKTAEKYYKGYKEFGGVRPMKDIINDFYIVACASRKEMNIVVTNDNCTMLGELSVKAYKLVNEILNLRTPEFWGYSSFKRWLL